MRLSKEEFEERIKDQELHNSRRDLLFEFIQGKQKVSHSCKRDIEEYALKFLMPEAYKSLPHEKHPYSTNEFYEYDPPKNGQNIIKHGIGFGEVVSYSRQFGTLMVPVPNDKDGERCVIFSDLDLSREGDQLELPLSTCREMNYTISIAHHRDGKFRFFSSRVMSSRPRKYREDIKQTLGEIIPDAQARGQFVARCIEIVETRLLRSTSPAQPRPA